MTLTEWKELQLETIEGTVRVSKIMDVPFKENTVRYQVYNEEGTFDNLYDITTDEDGIIVNIE